MTDPNILRRLLDLERAYEQTRTKEVITYATGTWTPEISGDGATPGTFTYTASATGGSYTRTGNTVHYRGRAYITAITVAPTAGSNMRISLPTVYTVATKTFVGPGHAYLSQQTGITFTAGYHQLGGYVLNGSPYIYLAQSGSGVAALNIVAANVGLVGGAIDFIFAGSYEVT